jgi:hypothetical protein
MFQHRLTHLAGCAGFFAGSDVLSAETFVERFLHRALDFVG